MFLKDSESAPLNSPMKPGKESLLPKDNAWLSINWLKLLQPAKTYCWSEVPEIEKLRGISVFTQAKEDHTLLPESDLKVDTLKGPEEEDDNNDLFTYLKL